MRWLASLGACLVVTVVVVVVAGFVIAAHQDEDDLLAGPSGPGVSAAWTVALLIPIATFGAVLSAGMLERAERRSSKPIGLRRIGWALLSLQLLFVAILVTCIPTVWTQRSGIALLGAIPVASLANLALAWRAAQWRAYTTLITLCAGLLATLAWYLVYLLFDLASRS